jgi:hypothetical protein
MMPQLRNFVRGGGTVAAAFGSGRGGLIAPLRLGSDDVSAIAAVAAEIAPNDRVTSVRLLATDTGRTAVRTIEKGMRTEDRSFAALLLVEGLDAAAIRAALAAAMRDRPPSADLTIYQTIFSLDRSGL